MFQIIVLILLCSITSAVRASVNGQSAVDYLLSCQKENGAFGPRYNPYTDLAWNYPAVAALLALGEEVPRAAEALENGTWSLFDGYELSIPPFTASPHEDDWWEMYQKAHLYQLLGGDGPPEIEEGRTWDLSYTDRDLEFNWRYRGGTYSDMPTLWYMVSALDARNGTVSNTGTVSGFVTDRQSPSGGFVDSYENGAVLDAEANIMITHHAVMTLTTLNQTVPNSDKVISWLQSCQTPSGGFRWNPASASTGNIEDVWYTWGAVRALQALGANPSDVDGAVAWLNSLQNTDGGFADRPGWSTRIYSTYYAVDALRMLTGDARAAITAKEAVPDTFSIPENKYNIYMAYTHGPDEGNANGESGQRGVVEGVKEIGIDLYGLKTGNVNTAEDYVASRGYDMVVLGTTENQHHSTMLFGGKEVNHISNWYIPPDMTGAEQSIWDAADQAGTDRLHWDDYKEQVLRPALEIGTLFFPEWDWTMPKAYMMYDDGLGGNPGYSAIIAGKGTPVFDWLRLWPYRERWTGQLPMVVSGDSHADLEGWMHSLVMKRMLFFAESNTYENFLDAARNNRLVTVIYDQSLNSGVTFYGHRKAVIYAINHQDEWRPRWKEIPELEPVAVKQQEKVLLNEKSPLKIIKRGKVLSIFISGSKSYQLKFLDLQGKTVAGFSGLTGGRWQKVNTAMLVPGIYNVVISRRGKTDRIHTTALFSNY